MIAPLHEQQEIGTTGLYINPLGFGCAPIGNLYHAISDDLASSVLQASWDAGFRYYDTAPHYGQGLSERRTGDLLRPLEGKDYLLSTKVGRLLKPSSYKPERHGFRSPMPFDFKYDYSYDGVMRSFEDSLLRLGLERVDILYMHDIGADTHGKENDCHFPIAMQGGYKAMRELKDQGLVKAIGLGVNEYQVCDKALDHGDWDCFLLAGRYTLLEQNCLESFLPRCERRNCSIIVGGPYNSGILATGSKGTPYYNYEPAGNNVIKHVQQIERLCFEFKVTLAAASLQFPMAHPCVVSVIPGLGNVKRIKQTIALFNEKIPAEFWQALKNSELLNALAPTPND